MRLAIHQAIKIEAIRKMLRTKEINVNRKLYPKKGMPIANKGGSFFCPHNIGTGSAWYLMESFPCHNLSIVFAATSKAG